MYFGYSSSHLAKYQLVDLVITGQGVGSGMTFLGCTSLRCTQSTNRDLVPEVHPVAMYRVQPTERFALYSYPVPYDFGSTHVHVPYHDGALLGTCLLKKMYPIPKGFGTATSFPL